MHHNLNKLHFYLTVFFLYQASYLVLGFDHPVTHVLLALNIIGFILVLREPATTQRKKEAVTILIKIVLSIAAFGALVRLLLYLEPYILG